MMADILPFGKVIEREQLQRIFKDEPVDLYAGIRANAAPRHRALTLRAGSIFVVPSLRASITFAIMLVCTLYAVKLAVIG